MRQNHVRAGSAAVLLLAAASLLVASPAVAVNPDSDFTYTLSGGTITITGFATGIVDPTLEIPSTITDGGTAYPVTTIGVAAFQSKALTSLVIPSSVSTIMKDAFRQNSITSVEIPTSVTSIGDNAFRGNVVLASVTIPNSVTSIGTFAFYNNALTSIVIPDSITSISNNAFNGNALTSIVIPSSVKSIGNYSFNNNPTLASVTIPASVTSLGIGAFAMGALTSVTFEGLAPTISTANATTGSLGAGTTVVVYYQGGATGFTSPWNGYTTRAISAAQSDLEVSPVGPLVADTTPYTFTVTVRDDTQAVVAGVPVTFTVPAGVAMEAPNCTTDATGVCTVSVSSAQGGTYLIAAQVGSDPTLLTASVVFAAPPVVSLAATGSDASLPMGIAAGLLVVGFAFLLRRKRTSA